jgi:hypothetical protein
MNGGSAPGAKEMSAQEEQTRNGCEKDGGYPKGNEKAPFFANKYQFPGKGDRTLDDVVQGLLAI